MPNISPELFNQAGNQAQYSGNQTTAIANMMAQMFGVSRIEDLPPAQQNQARQVASAIMNTYGDQMGMLNQGNLFANVHQGILASGSIPSTNSRGSLLGMASGAGARSMQSANIVSQVAGNYFAGKNGAPKLENTHGMSGQLFSGLAGAVVANRGIKQGDIMTVSSGKGSAQLLSSLQDATKNGASQESDQYKNAVQTYRVAREYEAFKNQHSEYNSREHQHNLSRLESLNKKKDEDLTDQERAEKRDLSQQVAEVNSQIREDFRNEAVGKKLKKTKVNGKEYGESEIEDTDATAAMDVVDNGGGQWEMGTEKLAKDFTKSLKATSKNVATLGKMFHTEDFGELQRAVNDIGISSLSDSHAVDDVAKRIASIQEIAEKTGRTVESVILEQKQIMEQLEDSFGGVDKIDPKTVAHIQRAGASADEQRNKLGHGPTGKDVQAEEGARTASALSGGAQHMAAGKKLLDMAEKGEVDVSDEDKEKMKKLDEAYRNAKTPQEQDRIAKEMQAVIKKSQGENTQGLYDEGVKEYGQEYADVRTERKLKTQRQKGLEKRFGKVSEEDVKEQKKQQKSEAEMVEGLDASMMRDIAMRESPEEREAYIQGIAENLEGEDKKKFLKTARKFAKSSTEEQDKVMKMKAAGLTEEDMKKVRNAKTPAERRKLIEEASKKAGAEGKDAAAYSEALTEYAGNKTPGDIEEMASMADYLSESDMKDIMDAKTPEERDKAIEKLAKTSGLSGKDLEEYKDKLKAFGGMTKEQQTAIRGQLRVGGAQAHVVTKAEKARAKAAEGKKQLQNELFGDETMLPEGQAGGLKGFAAGLMQGNGDITEKQAAMIAVAGYADENGQLGEKEIEKLNAENKDLNVLSFDQETGKLKNADKALDSKMVGKDGQEQEIWKMMGYKSKEEAVKASQEDVGGFAEKMRKFKEEQGYDSINLGNGNVALGKTETMEKMQEKYNEQRKVEKDARQYVDAFGGRITDVEIDQKTGKITGGKIDGEYVKGGDFDQRASEVASNNPEIQAKLAEARKNGMKYESKGEQMAALIEGMEKTGVKTSTAKNKDMQHAAAAVRNIEAKGREEGKSEKEIKEAQEKKVSHIVNEKEEDNVVDESKGNEESRQYAKSLRERMTAVQSTLTKKESKRLNKALEKKYAAQGLKGKELEEAVANASQADVMETLATNSGILNEKGTAAGHFKVLQDAATRQQQGLQAGGSQKAVNWKEGETNMVSNEGIAQGMGTEVTPNKETGGVATVDFSGLEKPLGQVASAVTSENGGALKVVVVKGDSK